MPGDGRADTYRLNAEQCLQLAQSFNDRERRLIMLGMANAWLTLAGQHLKNSEPYWSTRRHHRSISCRGRLMQPPNPRSVDEPPTPRPVDAPSKPPVNDPPAAKESPPLHLGQTDKPADPIQSYSANLRA
jgi:hypothetical protein